MTKSDKKWPKVTNIPLNSDIFPPKMTIFPQFVNNIPKICRFTHFCRQNLASRIRTFVVESTSVPGLGGVELNPGNASISLLLVKMSRVAFLLTFVVVCQDWKVEGAGGGVGGPQTAQVYEEWGCRC